MHIAHIGLLVSDLKQSAVFYEQILGLKRIERPALAFDGIWYGLAAGQQIHLMLLDNPCLGCARPEHGGRDHHLALAVEGFDAIRHRLESRAIACTFSRSGRRALFCRDPDGNTIELIAV